MQIEFSGLGPDNGGPQNCAETTTILGWMKRFVPEFEKCWSRYSRPTRRNWLCDEASIKDKGRWTHLYRTVDKEIRTVDFLLSERGDVAAVKRFFRDAMKNHETASHALDAYAA
jgi:transposase-like protein